MISAEELAYRERILESTRKWAQTKMPSLLRSIYAQCLQPLPAAVFTQEPATPLPEPVQVDFPDTGSIPQLQETTQETVIAPAIRLHQEAVTIHNTRELVSQAVRLFIEQYGWLPTRCLLNPMRVLSIEHPGFFPLDDECADLGCYTIAARSANLASDVVRLLARDRTGGTIHEDYSL